jgi:hypothetical protein
VRDNRSGRGADVVAPRRMEKFGRDDVIDEEFAREGESVVDPPS